MLYSPENLEQATPDFRMVSKSDHFWPPEEGFLRFGGQHLNNEKARCVGLAICNEKGEFTNRFGQGETAHFFVEFEATGDFQTPAGGIELLDKSGLVIFGKNSFQFSADIPQSVRAGTILRYHHWIDLQLAIGSYSVGLGLASADPDALTAYAYGPMRFEEFRLRCHEHVRVIAMTTIHVDWREDHKLTHHGLTNLPGGSGVHLSPGTASSRGANVPVVNAVTDPTLLHLTHWKAGSQWIYSILRKCMAERIVEPQAGEVQVRHAPIRPGHVYPTVYLNKRELDDVTLPENTKMFAVIRDLRDTLTSAYFSFKISHPILGESNANCREVLQQLDLEAGFLHLMENFLPSCAQIQLTWLEAHIPVLRYEDLLHNDIELLTEILLDRLKLPLDRDVLESAIVTSRFEAVTQGRAKGIEDLRAHERKGIAGDWRNHFTPRVTKAFKTRFGGLLTAAGYEQDLDW